MSRRRHNTCKGRLEVQASLLPGWITCCHCRQGFKTRPRSQGFSWGLARFPGHPARRPPPRRWQPLTPYRPPRTPSGAQPRCPCRSRRGPEAQKPDTHLLLAFRRPLVPVAGWLSAGDAVPRRCRVGLRRGRLAEPSPARRIGCPCAAPASPGRRLRTRHPHPQFLLTAPRRLYWSVPAGKWGSVCVRSLVTEGRPPDSGFQRHSSARNSHTCSSSGSSTSTLPGPPSQTLEMRHQDSDIGSSPFPSSFAPLRLRSRSPVALQGLEPPRFRRWWASTAGASYGDESTLGFPGSASAAGSRFLRLCLDARFALLSSGPTPRPSCSRRAAAGGAGGQQIYHA